MYSAALVGLKVKNQLRASRIVASRRRSYSFRIRSASSCLPISFSPCRFDDFLDSSALAMHSFERFRSTAALQTCLDFTGCRPPGKVVRPTLPGNTDQLTIHVMTLRPGGN